MKLILSDGTQIEIINSAPVMSPEWKSTTAKEAGEILDKVTEANTGTLAFDGDERKTIESTKLVKKFMSEVDGGWIGGFTWDYKSEADILAEKADDVADAIQELPDDSAVKYTDLYKDWESYTEGEELAKDLKLKYKDILYKVTSTHNKQSAWTPDTAATLFTAINAGHAGTMEDPIPWVSNMRPEKNKYYVEGELIAKCIEDPGIALHNKLSELTPGRYFEKAK